MTDLAGVLGGVLPIVALIGLGVVLRRLGVLDDATVAGLKRLIVNVALPAVLFTTFLSVRFEPGHALVIATVFVLLVALFAVGFAVRRPLGGSPYVPFLFTGFELGMLGFALFTAAFGLDRLPALGVLALGHEVFIWFFYASLLRGVGQRRRGLGETLSDLVRSPVIVAIVAGLALNAAGLGAVVREGVLGVAFANTLTYLAGLIVPLVLLVIGYSARLSGAGVREALPLVVARLAVVVPVALVLAEVVFRRLLGLDQVFVDALVTLMILPPPFIVPLFIPPQRRAEEAYATNVLSLYSLGSVLIFVGYVIVTRAGG